MSKKVYYYTLGDLAYFENPDWEANSSVTANQFSITYLCTKYGMRFEEDGGIAPTTYASLYEMLMRIVFDRFYSFDFAKRVYDVFNPISIYDVPWTYDDLRKRWIQFVNLINLTAPKYLPMLIQFNANAVNPIAKIQSTTTGINRFNDTPQEGGDWSDDNHTSTINQNEVVVEADTDSIVNRLNSLWTNWKSIILEWSNEFKRLFFISGHQEEEEL